MVFLFFLLCVGVISLLIYTNYYDDVVMITPKSGDVSLGWRWKGNFEIIARCKKLGDGRYFVEIEADEAYSYDPLSRNTFSTIETISYMADKNIPNYPILFESYNFSGEVWWYILTIKVIEKADGVQLRLRNTRSSQKPIIEEYS